jgi:hypothetical protein
LEQGHLLGLDNQRNGNGIPPFPSLEESAGGGLLSNPHLQEKPRLFTIGYSRAPVREIHPKIEALKRLHFTEEGRALRVARSLEALAQPNPIRLPREEWIWVAEALDAEEEYE